jgi:protein-tyrosine sulfotransferase
LHGAVSAFPRGLFEFPLVELAPGARALQHEWLAHFPGNGRLVEEFELFGYLASGWLAALQAEAPNRRLLMKSPHVRQIGIFRAALPRDKLVLCLRDGRDVIASTLATFEGGLLRKSFRQLVMEWRLATEAVLAFAPGGPRENGNTVVVRYEDMVEQPRQVLRQILPMLDLDPADYPFDELDRLPVYGSSTSREQGRQSWQPVTRQASFKPIGRFASWPEHRKRLFDQLAGEVLQRAGYH